MLVNSIFEGNHSRNVFATVASRLIEVSTPGVLSSICFWRTGRALYMEKCRLVHGNVIPMGIPWETSHGMGRDRHKLLCYGMGMGQINMSLGQPWKNGFRFLFQINGICGNFNGRKQDDLEMQSGQQASNFSEFAQSYIVGQCGKKLPEPFVCSDAEKRRW